MWEVCGTAAKGNGTLSKWEGSNLEKRADEAATDAKKAEVDCDTPDP